MGAVHRYDPCQPADRQSANFVTVVPRDAKLLPPEFQARAEVGLERAVCDYIAGMTDRYAILEHRRIFDIEEQA